MSSNAVENIHNRMAEKARNSLDYHMDVWKSHISPLCRLISSSSKPGALTYERWQEIEAELLVAAKIRWGD